MILFNTLTEVIMKSMILAVLVMTSFVFVPRINAEEKKAEPKFSIEVGGGKAFAPWSSGEEISLSGYKSSSMISAKIGYAIWRNLEVQTEYNYLGFEKKDISIYGADNVYKSKRDRVFTTLTANVKYSLPMNAMGISISPYIIGGIGIAMLNNRGSMTQDGTSTLVFYRLKWRTIGAGRCWKMGGGTNIKLYKNLYLFSEYNYWKMKVRWKNQWSDTAGGTFTSDRGSTSFAYSTISGGIGLKF